MHRIARTYLTLAIGLIMTAPVLADLTAQPFGEVLVYKLTNSKGMKVHITNYGAIITSIVVPDRNGTLGDVALGYDNLRSYTNAIDRPYFGAIVGRYGNRIANGKFSIDGTEYTLATNNDPNHLHGGHIGFDKVIWDSTAISGDGFSGVQLKYLAKDGEEGYPGNLDITVTYKLTNDNVISVEYEATTDKATHCNLTQHSYFNLKGEGDGDILGHEMMINADKFTPVSDKLIPTGELAGVEGTPFDFRTAKSIGKDIEADHEQLKFGLGFDHNFVVNEADGKTMKLAARVHEPTSGRVMEVHTTEPGIQFYCGNFLNGKLKGKSGRDYVHRGGFCLETQHYPDSPNQPNFPTTLLKPGGKYSTKTTYTFSTK